MKIFKELKCCYCKKIFRRYIKEIRLQSKIYCSQKCNGEDRQNKANVKCKQCNNTFAKKISQIKKTKNNFCSKSCAATYNNTHKTKGTKISKLEIWLAEQLPKLYPDLEFHFNRKDAIESELDIYVPSLKLAFELNGIFHYEPIFGQEKLASIQNNDNRKFQACLEKNIELCIIDSSQLKYFKPQKAQKYLDIIYNIINNNLVRQDGFEPPYFRRR